MGKHYCRKDGAPVALMSIPPYVDPGHIVQNDDRVLWESPTYGRVRMLFRCCGTALVQFIDDAWEGTTHTDAIAIDKLSRVPDGIMVSVPCIGADWSADLPCGHVNGEGCDCDTIALEAAQGDAGDVTETLRNGMVNIISPQEADNMVTLFTGDSRFRIRRTWGRTSYDVTISTRPDQPPALSYSMPLI